MPFPAARYTNPDVDTTGNERPCIAACSYAQICCLFRCGELKKRQVRSCYMRQVQCGIIRVFPQGAAAISHAQQAHGDNHRQCSIPPCGAASAFFEEISSCPKVGILAAIQPAACADRTSLEARTATCDTQPVFCHAKRTCRSCNVMLRQMEKTESHIAEIMRHNIRRYV